MWGREEGKARMREEGKEGECERRIETGGLVRVADRGEGEREGKRMEERGRRE